MTPHLRVAASGLLATIQDLGRRGYQRFGIPVSGALDPPALMAANTLLGNPPGAGAIEVAYRGPTLVAEADEVRLAVVGARACLEVLPDETAASGTPLDCQRTFLLRRGEALRIGALSGGAVLYVAAEGGFDIAPVLGSVATDVRSRLGGLDGRALAAGDRVPLRLASAPRRSEVRFEDLSFVPPDRVRVILGPQHTHFGTAEIDRFLAAPFQVAPDSNRMALALDGERIAHQNGFDITSDAIAPGSIQVPGSGRPIILVADRQTTGGYPKIATVISADLPALSRLPIGAAVRFTAVTVEQAEAALRARHAEFERAIGRIVPCDAEPRDMIRRLFECNLISGVVSAAA